jgi:hypothetical protein
VPVDYRQKNSHYQHLVIQLIALPCSVLLAGLLQLHCQFDGLLKTILKKFAMIFS